MEKRPSVRIGDIPIENWIQFLFCCEEEQPTEEAEDGVTRSRFVTQKNRRPMNAMCVLGRDWFNPTLSKTIQQRHDTRESTHIYRSCLFDRLTTIRNLRGFFWDKMPTRSLFHEGVPPQVEGSGETNVLLRLRQLHDLRISQRRVGPYPLHRERTRLCQSVSEIWVSIVVTA